MNKKNSISAIGSMGIYAYSQALRGMVNAKAEVTILANFYRTPELHKLNKAVGRNLEELERIGVKMGMIKMVKK